MRLASLSTTHKNTSYLPITTQLLYNYTKLVLYFHFEYCQIHSGLLDLHREIYQFFLTHIHILGTIHNQ